MDSGTKMAVLLAGGAVVWGVASWTYRKLMGGPPREDPTVGDGNFGNTPED